MDGVIGLKADELTAKIGLLTNISSTLQGLTTILPSGDAGSCADRVTTFDTNYLTLTSTLDNLVTATIEYLNGVITTIQAEDAAIAAGMNPPS